MASVQLLPSNTTRRPEKCPVLCALFWMLYFGPEQFLSTRWKTTRCCQSWLLVSNSYYLWTSPCVLDYQLYYFIKYGPIHMFPTCTIRLFPTCIAVLVSRHPRSGAVINIWLLSDSLYGQPWLCLGNINPTISSECQSAWCKVFSDYVRFIEIRHKMSFSSSFWLARCQS